MFEGRLKSLYMQYTWSEGVNTAACTPFTGPTFYPVAKPKITAQPHPSPHEACACGFYAWHPERLNRMSMNDGYSVWAAVLGWGTVCVHEDGWRAQYAEIALLHAGGHLLEKLAETYDLPMAPSKDDFKKAIESGDLGKPVPKSLRPGTEWA